MKFCHWYMMSVGAHMHFWGRILFSGSMWNLRLSLSSQQVSFLIEALTKTLLQTPLESVERLQLASMDFGWSPDQALHSLWCFGLKAIVWREKSTLIHDALTHCCGVWAHTRGITSHPESLCFQCWEQTFPGCVQPWAICPGQSRWGVTSQKAEHQGAAQSQARMYSHQEGTAITCQGWLYQQVSSLPWEYRSSVGLDMVNMYPRPWSDGSHPTSSCRTNCHRRRHFAYREIIPWCHPEGLYVQMPAQTPRVQCDLAFPIREGKKDREEEIRKHPETILFLLVRHPHYLSALSGVTELVDSQLAPDIKIHKNN